MKVEPAKLRVAASVVDACRTDLHSANTSAHRTMEASVPGWTGASAVALGTALARWRTQTATVDDALNVHQETLTAAATAYGATDAANASTLTL